MMQKRKAETALEPELAVTTRSLRPRAQPYEYDLLLPGEIRILVLHPGKPDQDLHATLETVTIDDEPEYKAISYAWGEPIFDQTLPLPGGILKITTSLGGALRRLRDPKKTVRLWADAVCIDQSTTEEKNLQVAMMGEIYSKADEVLIWLGESETTDAEFFWLLDALLDANQQFKADRERLGYFEVALIDYYPNIPPQGSSMACPCCNTPFLVQSASVDQAAESFVAFWDKPWFKRLWVVQECLLAKSVTFFCGSHRISFPRFCDANDFLGLIYKETAS